MRLICVPYASCINGIAGSFFFLLGMVQWSLRSNGRGGGAPEAPTEVVIFLRRYGVVRHRLLRYGEDSDAEIDALSADGVRFSQF